MELDLPLTQRLLALLPGPRWAWFLLLGVLFAVRPLVVSASEALAGEAFARDEFLATLPAALVLGYMALLALWSAGYLYEGAKERDEAARSLLPRGIPLPPRPLSRGLGSVKWPVLLTAAATVFSILEEVLWHGPYAALASLPIAVLANLAVMTLFWVFVRLLANFSRLGSTPLVLDRYPQDPSLGLRPLGFLGFWSVMLFLALIVPFLLVNARRPMDLTLGIVVALAPTVLLFLSFVRLHRQMLAFKMERLRWARNLYAEAFAPVAASPTPDCLTRHEAALRTADTLLLRAGDIWEWPLSTRTAGLIGGVTLGVVTSIIARFVLTLLGL